MSPFTAAIFSLRSVAHRFFSPSHLRVALPLSRAQARSRHQIARFPTITRPSSRTSVFLPVASRIPPHCCARRGPLSLSTPDFASHVVCMSVCLKSHVGIAQRPHQPLPVWIAVVPRVIMPADRCCVSPDDICEHLSLCARRHLPVASLLRSFFCPFPRTPEQFLARPIL